MPHFSALIGQHYAYAHGRIGVLKQLLLSSTDIDRLLGTSSIQGAVKTLREQPIASVVDGSIDSGDKLLSAIGAWMREEVNAMVPDAKKPLLSILWLDGDTPELSYYLKKFHGLTSEISVPPTSFMSAYPASSLEQLVTEGDTGNLPTDVVDFVASVKNMSDLKAADIDALTANFIAEKKLRLARTSGSSDMVRYVRHTIDIHNIRTALRLHETDSTTRRAQLLTGGTLDPESLLGSKEETMSAISKCNIGYIFNNNDALDDPLVFEREAAGIIASDIAHMWNIPLSIDPVFAFAAITITQLRLVRAIFIAKRNELSPQEIKKIQPPFLAASHYVL